MFLVAVLMVAVLFVLGNGTVAAPNLAGLALAAARDQAEGHFELVSREQNSAEPKASATASR